MLYSVNMSLISGRRDAVTSIMTNKIGGTHFFCTATACLEELVATTWTQIHVHVNRERNTVCVDELNVWSKGRQWNKNWINPEQ